MKKTVLVSVGLLFYCSTLTFAQKAAVNKVYNSLYVQPVDYAEAVKNIEAAKVDTTTAKWSKTWYVAGRIGYVSANEEINKLRLQQEANQEKLFLGLDSMYVNYLIADQYDGVVNKKGVVKYTYRNDIKTDFKEMHLFYINSGAALFDAKEYAKAYTMFDQYLKIADLPMFEAKDGMKVDSTYNMIKYYAAIAAIKVEDRVNAIRHFEELLKTNYTKKEDVCELLYEQYRSNGDTVKSMEILKEGAEKYPQSPFFIGNLINYYTSSGKYDEAITYLDAAIQREPSNVDYLNLKGSLCVQTEKFEDAKAVFTKSLSLNDKNPFTLFGMGKAWAFEGDKIQSKAQDLKDNKAYQKEVAKAKEYYTKALSYLEPAKASMDKQTAEYSNLLYNMKSLYLRLNMTDKYKAIDEEMKAL